MFLTDLQAKMLPDGQIRLLTPLIWQTDTDTITVPRGFISDGASVPRAFWWFCPPLRGPHARAAVLHDHLCVVGKDQRRADRIFLEALESCGVGWFRRRVMFRAVSIYQWARGRY